MGSSKEDVFDFWNAASCGEDLLLESSDKQGYINQSNERYKLEPFILNFAEFSNYRQKDVLEIGVGLGSDHQKFAEYGANLTGIDLTDRAIEHAKYRFKLLNLNSNLRVGDAEKLDFKDSSFDLVYSWGVIHHSPDTPTAVKEIHRVLRPGGEAKIMIYYKWSLIGFMLWIRYALMAFKPFTSLNTIYANYLESPGTKAYTINEANKLFHDFDDIQTSIALTHGDLLSSGAGQRHQGILLNLAKKIWPRWLIKICFKNNGLFLLVKAKKTKI